MQLLRDRARKLIPVAAIAIFALQCGLTANYAHQRGTLLGDFRAFYCAGYARLNGGDPYAREPLARCEQQPVSKTIATVTRGQVVPAPIPGYLVAALVPLGALPLPAAALLWVLISLGALACGVALLARTGVADPWTLLVAVAIPFGVSSIPAGELPPIAFAGIALAAYGLHRNRMWPLAFGLALAMAEPQVGIACALGAVLLRRQTALVAVGTLATLAVISVATLGLSGNLDYVFRVLPAHIYAELPSVRQYSLSWVLNSLGASAGTAIFAGRLSYLLMLALAALVARSQLARIRPELAVLAAAAFAVFGGPFVHLDHIALAIPAALYLSRSEFAFPRLQLAAAAALAVPVLTTFAFTDLIVLAPATVAWLVIARTGNADAGLRSGTAAIVYVLFAGLVAIHVGTATAHMSASATTSINATQAFWAQYIRRYFVMNANSVWLGKAPTWCALAITAACALVSSLRREPAASPGLYPVSV